MNDSLSDRTAESRPFQFTGRTRSHPLVRAAKDVAAGAVLITAVAAAMIGAIIFWPHLGRLFR